MLTVKLVEPNGHEQIRSALEVVAEPAPTNGRAAVRVLAWTPGAADPVVFADYGTVYVMNDAGQTVARYYLGEGQKQQPEKPKGVNSHEQSAGR